MSKFFNEDVNAELDKSGSSFFELEPGDNKVRIVSGFAWGYKYDYAHRAEAKENEYPFYATDSDEASKLAHKLQLSAAMVLYDYREEGLKSFNVHQQQILKPIRKYVENEEYGDLENYDIIINKTGSGRDVEYSVIANPPKKMPKEIKDALDEVEIDMDKVYDNESPIAREE